MLNTTRCEHCNRELEPISALGIIVSYKSCSCPKAQAKLKEQEIEAERERRQKEQKLREERYRRAGIPFRYMTVSAPCDQYVRAVLDGQGLYITGCVGVGKTHLATVVAKRLVNEGLVVRFVTSIDMLSEIRDTYGSKRKVSDVLSRFSKCDVLVIDDLGKEAPTDWALSMLFQIINDRYENKRPVVVTTQFSSSELVEILGANSRSENAKAIISRLYGMCVGVELRGEDRRLVQ